MSAILPTGRRVAAIVPAYNEQETLAEVVEVLKATPLVHEILVISDGSTDGTFDIARNLEVRAIHLRENHGKGMAMAIGVERTSAPLLLFVDGDILNLSESLLTQLMEPVLSGRSDMNIGIRNRGRLINAVHRRTGPLLSGIRCLRREIFEAVPASHLEGFAIETGLNWACRRLGLRTTTTVLYHLRHLVKERKRGFVPGFQARFRMFGAVFAAWMVLHIRQPPLRNRTLADIPVLKPEIDYIDF